MLTDGDTSKFLHWSSSPRPILLLFAFDSIKEFQSIELDLKCAASSSSCTLRIDVGIFEVVRSSHPWSNRFRPLTISNDLHSSEATLTHLILAVGQGKGQFVIVRITADAGLALSEVTFNNRNEYDTQDILPSSIYVENNLHRLELALFNTSTDSLTGKKEIGKDASSLLFIGLDQHKLWSGVTLLLLACAFLVLITLISCLFIQHKHDQHQ